MPSIEVKPKVSLSKTNILTLTQDDVNRYVRACLQKSCKIVRDYARTHHAYEDQPDRQKRDNQYGLTRAILYRTIPRKSAKYGYVGEVYVDEKKAPYAKYQIEGTSGHGPVRAKGLTFFSDRFGKWYKDLAWVSGIKPDDFLGRALKNNRVEINYIFEQGLRELMKEHGKL